jgi:hypothetical protein
MFKPRGVMFLTLVFMLMAFSCSGPESDQTLLTAELPLHLGEHIEAASIEGSEIPEDLPAPVVSAQDTAQSEREAMYYPYLEFPSLVKGGSIEPHRMADGSSFWYAEGDPA